MSADVDTLALIAELEDPQRIYPGNFETEGKAVAILLCLCQDGATELRRLHAVNQELLEALELCLDRGSMTGSSFVEDKARAAIAKATGEKA